MPSDPAWLVGVVSARAQRGRVLRGYMVRDSLTGFLNHAAILGQLQMEVVRAKRQGLNLAFAMLDLDKFKQVNDNHGHRVGDQVLRSLARLLERRLRRTDLIGRYGGEEFAIIFPDTDLEAACRVLEDVRAAFCALPLAFPTPVMTSFSVGVASFPDYPDSESLILAADEALYEAKATGRNCISCR